MDKIYELLQGYAVNFLEYQKGRALNQRGQAALSSVEESHGIVGIQATVRDLSSRYDIRIRIHALSGWGDGSWDSFCIKEAVCSCHEYHVQGKLCRHQIAALLQYFFAGASLSCVHTSSACTSMIQSYRKRYTLAFARTEMPPVQVIPRFLAEGKSICMEFYVGSRHMYPVRDLIQFKRSYQKNEEISFGKQLSFTNCEYSYDPDSVSLIQVLCLQIDSYLHHWSQREEYTVYGQKLERVELEEGFADLYMKAFCGRELEYIEDGKSGRITVIAGNPSIKLIIEKKGKDGARLWIPEKWRIAEGNRHIYLFGQDHAYICDEHFSRDMRNFFHGILVKAYPGTGYVDINYSDFPAFIHYVLPVLQKYLTVECRDIDLDEFVPPAFQTESVVSISSEGFLQLKIHACYGTVLVLLDGKQTDLTGIVRDIEKEQALRKLIHRYFSPNPQGNYYVLEERDLIYEFLENGLQGLYAFGQVQVAKELEQIQFNAAPRIRAGLRFMDHFLRLDFKSDGLDAKQVAAILAGYHQKRRYHVLEDGRVLKLDEEFGRQLEELEQVLEIDAEKVAEAPVSLPGYRFLFADELLGSMKGVDYQPGKEIREMAERMNRSRPEQYPVPEQLANVLREYQVYGYRWMKMLQEYHFNGILADDMGLGKTIQAIALLYADRGKGCSLIICPASLIFNWQHEFEVFARELRILPVAGSVKERHDAIEQYAAYDVLITSYDLLRRDIGEYRECRFYYQILDEAQYIKNHTTMNARAVKQVSAQFRLALTGTPIENSLGELWSIFDYLMPGYLYSYTRFHKLFEVPITKGESDAAKARLRRMTAPFLLRRAKAQVLSDLPEKDEKTIYSGMEEEQRKLYLAVHKELLDQLKGIDSTVYEKNRIMILSQLTRLRQICCHPGLCFEDYQGGSAKLEACLELLHRALKGKHKVLLFSQFTSMLELIRKELEKQGIGYYCLTGSTDKQERQRLVEAFQTDSTGVFLISLKAGGTGLNLTAADIVIHYDPWWNVAAQNQATDRVHRIGQERTVTVYRLIAKDTLEEGILRLQESKKALSDDILSMDFGAISAMSKEELLALLSGEVADYAQ